MILCGGKGSRLQGVVADRPKPMAMIGGRPFLDLLIEALMRQGVRRFILCIGHLGEQIVAHYRSRIDAEFVFSQEETPLGTGGAVRQAAGLVRSDPFILLNGDSWCAVDCARLVAFHHERKAAVSIVVAPARERNDGGTVELAPDGRILGFHEKNAGAAAAHARINAGIYVMRRDLPAAWPAAAPLSLERDVFPRLTGSDHCYGFPVEADVVDIGTPDRYAAAQRAWGKTGFE